MPSKLDHKALRVLAMVCAISTFVSGLCVSAQTESDQSRHNSSGDASKNWQKIHDDGEREFWRGRQTPGADIYRLRKHALAQMEAMRQVAAASNPSLSLSWQSIGPDVVNWFGVMSAGATAGMAVSPTDPNTVYYASAGGGVWKTTNAGTTWTSLTDQQAFNQNWSFTLDPNNPNTLYVGAAASGYSGGILKSTDGGTTWADITGPFVGPFGPDSIFGGSIGIYQLAVQPGSSSIMLAGTSGNGVYRTTDGGNTWAQVFSGQNTGSIMFDPQHPSTAYAAMCRGYGSTGGIYKSVDAGVTWNILGGGLPSPTSVGGNNCFLNISPSNPSTLVAEFSLQGKALMYLTNDGGNTWTQLTSAPDNPHSVGVFFHPTNPNIIFVGSAELFRSMDGGKTWAGIALNYGVHPDDGGYAFVGNSNQMYLGTDGGVFYTSDITATPVSWTDLNHGLATLRIYPGMSIHPTNANVTIGGTQDEGTILYSGSPTWNTVACGDGGSTAIDQTNPNNLFLDCYNADVEKSTDGGASFASAASGINASDAMNFFPPLAIDPSNGSNLYFGTAHVYQTTNAAASWTSISPAFNPLNSISVSPKNSNTVYAADSSGIWATTSALSGTSSTWTKNTGGLPPRQIAQVVADIRDANTAFAVVQGYSGFGDSMGHVFETTNAGATWSDISGNLPNIPATDFAIDPDIPSTYYVATDAGVLWTSDGGKTWAPYGTGLPNTVVTGIRFFAPTRLLRISTFGRGMWDIAGPIVPGTKATPTVTLTTSASSINSAQQLQVSVSVSGSYGTPTGSAIVTSGSYTSSAATLNNGAAQFTIGAGALTVGTDTLTVSYTPDSGSSSTYATATATASVTVSQAPPPDFGLSNGGNITVTRGATSGNTSIITVTPSGGFTGTVNLTCSVSPNNLTSPPTCNFSSSSVSITGNAKTAILTVNTTAATSAFNRQMKRLFSPAGGAVLALLCFFGIPGRWRTRSVLWSIILAVTTTLMIGCSGGGSGGGGTSTSGGTTPGAYTVTLTAASGTLTHSANVQVTVN